MANAINYRILIDGTTAEQPNLKVFNKQSELVRQIVLSDFDREFPDWTLSEEFFEDAHFLIPALDIQYFPLHIFEESDLENYGRFVLDDGVTPLKYTEFPSLGVVAIYRENLQLLGDLPSRFPMAKRHVLSAVVLQRTVELNGSGDSALYIVCAGQTFTMTVFNQGQFIYQRDFHCGNEDEFNYHLINVLGMSDQHASNLRIVLSGQFKAGDTYVKRIEKYGKNIEITDLNLYSAIL